MLDSAMMNFTTMRTLSPLTRQEQAVLAVRAKTGDEKALSVLIETNINLAIKIALQHHRNLPKHSVSPHDLLNTAVLAMKKAVEPFEPDKNISFGSYAAFFMRRDIMDYIHEAGIIYVPKRKDGTVAMSPSYCYLDADAEDFYVPGLGHAPEQLGIETEMDVEAALACLSPKQRRVIELRFGFINDIEVSFSAMGKEAGTSRSPHITQYNKAMQKLREFFGAENGAGTNTESGSGTETEQRCNERGCEVKHARHKKKTVTS